MIDHTGLQVSDPTVSRTFYDNALAPRGYKMMMVQIPKEHTGGAAVFGYGVPPKADFWVKEGTPNDPRLHMPSVPKLTSKWTSSTELCGLGGMSEPSIGERDFGASMTLVGRLQSVQLERTSDQDLPIKNRSWAC